MGGIKTEVMTVMCIKEYKNKDVKVGRTYAIIDADIGEYLIEIEKDYEIWISKDDIEHFRYSV